MKPWRSLVRLVRVLPILVVVSVPCMGIEIPFAAKTGPAPNAIEIPIVYVTDTPPIIFPVGAYSEQFGAEEFRISKNALFLPAMENGTRFNNIELNFLGAASPWPRPFKHPCPDFDYCGLSLSLINDMEEYTYLLSEIDASVRYIWSKKPRDNLGAMGGIKFVSSQIYLPTCDGSLPVCNYSLPDDGKNREASENSHTLSVEGHIGVRSILSAFFSGRALGAFILLVGFCWAER